MHIMNSMVQNNGKREVLNVEKAYKTMSGSGALNIVLGTVVAVIGVASGVLLMISGAKLLAAKSKIIF